MFSSVVKRKMKTVETIINETLNSPAKGDAAIQAAVNQLLGEDINSGDTVVSTDDDSTFPYQGVEGKCKGPSAKGSGFFDVEYPDGTTVPMQASLLIKRQK
jgi:hypothetical protein